MTLAWGDMNSPFDGQKWRRFDYNGDYKCDVWNVSGITLYGTGQNGTDAEKLTDVDISFSIQLIDGDTDYGGKRNKMLGPVFRHTADSFYFVSLGWMRTNTFGNMLATCDWRAWKYVYGEGWTELADWQRDDIGDDDGSASTVRFTCIGTDIVAYNEGDVVGTVSDSSITAGTVGLLHSNHEYPENVLFVDDYTVSEVI